MREPLIPVLEESSRPMDDDWFLEKILGEQRQMTAIEKFSKIHEDGELPAQEKYYRELIPLSKPGKGQQYSFEVDLDACTGCKACVVACHSLNGLDEFEAWREVGLLQGGTYENPFQQNVTTACHHCLSPACMDGCPVKAYVKDSITGIVKHLDDQCIGCQYCVLKCPYDVPKYNKAKGIVRKCDMCSDRLAVGQAPACVQACPNKAIGIRIVETVDVLQRADEGVFLPGAPDPGYTLPTTRYITKKELPANLLPGDHTKVEAEHAHLPLVFMLVLTQMSVGAFLVEQSLKMTMAKDALAAVRPVHAVVSLALGVLALVASTLHLGRPLYAFRAVLGLRTSWLSREILAFGIFSGLAGAYAFLFFFLPQWQGLQRWLGPAVALSGLLAVFCSMMVYHDTRRVFWDISLTGFKFSMTMVVLGLPLALVTSLAGAALSAGLDLRQVMSGWGLALCGLLIAASLAKMLFELTVFGHLKDLRHSPMFRTATLMAGELRPATKRRFILGVVGGVLAPAALLLLCHPPAGLQATPSLAVWALAGLALAASLGGEIHERYLYFTAVVSPKMPGGVM